MLPTALRNRVLKSCSLALGAVTAVLLSPAPAHAAVDVPVYIALSSNGTKLGGLYGTLTFESNTRYSYSLVLCRDSSYVPTSANVFVSGVYHDYFGYDGSAATRPECLYPGVLKAGTVEYGGTVTSVGFTVRGVYFNGSTNQATDRTRSATYDNPLN
jgi:hypothetical protein